MTQARRRAEKPATATRVAGPAVDNGRRPSEPSLTVVERRGGLTGWAYWAVYGSAWIVASLACLLFVNAVDRLLTADGSA